MKLQLYHVFFVIGAVIISGINGASFSNTAGNINSLNSFPMSRQNPFLRNSGCPLCDSSVYSYCSHKMFHDACCCGTSYGPGLGNYQCQFSNCHALHANTCYEHNLITHCCCNSPYR